MAGRSTCGRAGPSCTAAYQPSVEFSGDRRPACCSRRFSSSRPGRRRNRQLPFENHGNRSFTAISIGKNAPPASGVYGLADSGGWIYVGETSDIRAELMRHLQNPHAFLREHPPSGFTYELSTSGQRIDRQNQLVSELEPIGNRLV